MAIDCYLISVYIMYVLFIYFCVVPAGRYSLLLLVTYVSYCDTQRCVCVGVTVLVVVYRTIGALLLYLLLVMVPARMPKKTCVIIYIAVFNKRQTGRKTQNTVQNVQTERVVVD